MSIYAIGDLHLSFSPEVEKPMDLFGHAWKDHAQRLKMHWLELVKPEDTVIIPGDISWGLRMSEAIPDLDWIDALPGKKLIFKGNHDLWWQSVSKLNNMYDSIYFVQNKAVEVEGYYICGSRGWIGPGHDDYKESDEKIYKRELMRIQMSIDDAKRQGAEKIIGVLHYPPSAGNTVGSSITDMFKECGAEQVIYGHLHGPDSHRSGLKGNYDGVEYKLVALDYLNCRPLLIKE
ncbi:MAG: metallophosphoesterase [Firmicutes bacterium]|nr:metallophosphoesterase [Bacillota bacterium]